MTPTYLVASLLIVLFVLERLVEECIQLGIVVVDGGGLSLALAGDARERHGLTSCHLGEGERLREGDVKK